MVDAFAPTMVPAEVDHSQCAIPHRNFDGYSLWCESEQCTVRECAFCRALTEALRNEFGDVECSTCFASREETV